MDTMTEYYVKLRRPELYDRLKAAEAVLGIDLYYWQATRIIDGYYRNLGVTTAEILKILMEDDKPIVFREWAKTVKERIFRRELCRIRETLDQAGIPVRKIIEKEQYRYMDREEKKELQEKEAIMIFDSKMLIPVSEMYVVK